MTFKAKLRKIGNSQGIYIPKKVITDYKIGEVITLEVITTNKEAITLGVEKEDDTFWCNVHGKLSKYCGCKK